MVSPQAHVLGGRAKGAKIRAGYAAAPNRCLHCDSPITARPDRPLSDARKKKFCNQSCNAKHNNAAKPKRPIRVQHCAQCGGNIGHKDPRKFCAACRRTNAEALANRPRGKGAVAMRHLHSHAKTVLRGRPKVCVRCGYNRHAEGAHLRPVSSFSITAPLREVNDPANLVMLCPNCHWELDRGMFPASELTPSTGG